MNNKFLQDKYTMSGRAYQLKMKDDVDILIAEDDLVRLFNEVLEGLDYTQLLRACSFTLPYRCFYSRNIKNLFFCERIISASHMAFASARVMATCAAGGQAVGTAAAIAAREGISPQAVGGLHIRELQQALLKDDCYIPGIRNEDALDLARSAAVEANAFLPGYEASALQSGITRQVDGRPNCWTAKLSDHPTLTFTLQRPAQLREIVCTFDSNLSREITISINERVLSGQSSSTPPELVKSFRISLLRGGKTVLEQKLDGLSQRHVKVLLDQSTECDSLRLDHFTTHGAEEVRLFEVRLYE